MNEIRERLARSAKERGIRLAVAESLTCGLLSAAIGEAPEAEAWYAGGVIAYQTAVKETILRLEPGTDPCSAACAEQLARGVRALLDVDLAVSTTGVGGPDPQDGHAPGTVYLGWATASEVGHHRFDFEGDPEQVLRQTVDEALALLVTAVDDIRS